MGFGAALFTLTAMQAVSQIGQGYAQKEEAKYNATLLEGKAGLIDVEKGIENAQYERFKAKTLSTSMANVAASGIMPTGSSAAVMVETQKQIAIDQAIGQFNLEQQKRYTLEEAETVKRQGRQAVYSGYSNAFSTMLSGASSYAMYKGAGSKTSFDLSSGAKGTYTKR